MENISERYITRRTTKSWEIKIQHFRYHHRIVCCKKKTYKKFLYPCRHKGEDTKRVLAQLCLLRWWWGIMKNKTTVNRDAFGIARFCSEYKTSEQRGQEGKSLREKVPRVSQAEFEVAPDRTDPVKVIKKSGEGRFEHLIPIRYGLM